MSSVDWKEKQRDQRRNEFLIDRSKIFKDVIVHWLCNNLFKTVRSEKRLVKLSWVIILQRIIRGQHVLTLNQQVSVAKSLPPHCFKTMVLVLQWFISWSVNKDCHFITTANYPFRQKGMHYNKFFQITFIDYKVGSFWDII